VSKRRITVLGIAMAGLVAGSLVTPAPVSAGGRCFGRRATEVGSPGDDTIVGTPGPDVILSLGGSDQIRGLAGNDRICSGRR
jgi:RTX calcium-binding nonapeptide repeat (4 copies)